MWFGVVCWRWDFLGKWHHSSIEFSSVSTALKAASEFCSLWLTADLKGHNPPFEMEVLSPFILINELYFIISSENKTAHCICFYPVLVQESQFTTKTTSQSGIYDEFITCSDIHTRMYQKMMMLYTERCCIDAGLLLDSSNLIERSFSHDTPPCVIVPSFISE